MSKLTRNIAYNLGGQLALVAVSFVAARYIFRDLGRDVLGLIYFAQTLNAIIITVVEVGIGATIVKEIAASEHDRPYVELVVRSGAAFAWIASASFRRPANEAARASSTEFATRGGTSQEPSVPLVPQTCSSRPATSVKPRTSRICSAWPTSCRSSTPSTSIANSPRIFGS